MFMSKKFKTIALGLTTVFAMSLFAGCGSSQNAASSGSGDKKNVKIGIVQLVEHNALDAANKGFVDGLKERGYEEGKNVTFDKQNAQADQSNLQNIAQRFVSDKVSLICAIATPAAQTVANATKDIPIVGTAITDYVGAKLVASNDAPKGNVTGTSDMNPVKEQIDLLMKLYPNAKTVGTIYCSSEVNSEVQVKAMKEYAESKGLKVEVFYEPTDNIIASSMPTLLAITDPAKKAVICGEPNMVKAGGLATYGIDYYKLGVQTGHMAADILDGKAKPESMAIEMAKDLKVTINKKEAAALGITIPDDVSKDADIVE